MGKCTGDAVALSRAPRSPLAVGWNRLGTRILPKLRSGSELTMGLEFAVTVKADGQEAS
jgi:hypothetical protein